MKIKGRNVKKRYILVLSFVLFYTVTALIFDYGSVNYLGDNIAHLDDFSLLSEKVREDNVYEVTTDDISAPFGKYVSTENSNGYDTGVYELLTGDYVEFNVTVPSAGEYAFALDIYSLSKSSLATQLNFEINGTKIDETYQFSTYLSSQDQKVSVDIYNNEVSPLQENAEIWSTEYVKDTHLYGDSLSQFSLNAGTNSIKVSNLNGNFYLGNIYVVNLDDIPTEEEFFLDKPSGDDKKRLIIEAENPLVKNSANALTQSGGNIATSPYSNDVNKINILEMQNHGTSVTYALDANEGIYNVVFNYKGHYDNTNSFVNIYVNNEIQHDGLYNAVLGYNSGFEYSNNNFNVYLEDGINLITFELTQNPLKEISAKAQELANEMNDLYLDLIKLVSSSTSPDRDWDVESYIPGATQQMKNWHREIGRLIEIADVSLTNKKKDNDLTRELKKAYEKIGYFANDIDELPNNLKDFAEGSTSAVKSLANVTSIIESPRIVVDKIVLSVDKSDLPKNSSNIFVRIGSMFRKLLKSGVVAATDGDEVEIWVNRSRYHIALMQQYADTFYTPESGISIRFSALPSEDKLILANAAGTAPDAAMGLSNGQPYDLGIKNAIYDLRQFDDFNEFASQFAPGAFVSLTDGYEVYGFPETQNFYVTYYRTDIMEEFELAVPNTYDEIIAILPTLQRYGMNYFLPMSSGAGTKSIATTAPFIIQNGGSLYAEDGLSTNLTSPEAVEGIYMMVDLFKKYSLPLQEPNFYDSFRYGSLPIGISDFNTYLQLLYAAPEITGKWDIALHPGYADENGVVNRTMPGSAQTGLIFNSSDKKEEAWDFIKWWMSTETQTSFMRDLELTYGSGFVWNSANLEAFSTISFNKDHVDVILEQYEHLEEIPRVPGMYAVERELSNVWNASIFDGEDTRILINQAELSANREIKRKMLEYGYIDSNGNPVVPYIVPSRELIEEWLNG